MKKLWMLMLLATACAPVYVPNSRNAPLFTEAGEFQGSMQFGNGLELQGAVSVTNHLGLMVNYSYADRTGSIYDLDADALDDYHYHQFLEGGIGYFENQGNWCYEVFVGYGKGEGSSYDAYVWWGNQSELATGKYDRYFIQPAFGLNKKVMHLAIVPRVSIVDFKAFSSDSMSYEINENPKVFFEPAVIGRVNLMQNRMFFVFQVGFSIPATSNLFYEYRPFQFSTGLGLRLGGVRKARAVDPQ
jgi:hypothetical protein